MLKKTDNPLPASLPAARRRSYEVFALLGLAIVALGLVAAGGYFWWTWSKPPEPPAVDLTDAEPNVVAAIQKAQAGVREKPADAATWGRLGLILRAHVYVDEADVCFARAESLDPTDPRWPYMQGLHLHDFKPEAALPFIERAVDRCAQNAPDKTAPRLLLAEMLLDAGRTADAETQLHTVLKGEPSNPRANYDLGLAAFARDDLAACLRYWTPLTDNPFTRKKATAQLAVVYSRRDDEARAAQFSRQAQDLPPDLPWPDPYNAECEAMDVGRMARYRRADQLGQANRNGERFQLLMQLADEYQDSDASGKLAALLVEMGHGAALAEGEKIFREVLRQSPNTILAHLILGLALFQQGERLRDQGEGAAARAKYQEAAAEAARAAELKPDYGLAHLLRGLALKQLGEPAESLAALRRAVLCRPDNAEMHQQLGDALADNGLNLTALAELQIAVELGRKEPKIQETASAHYAQVLLRTFLPIFP